MDDENEVYDDEETKTVSHGGKKSNILPLWGNERTMNLNALILTNIQSSHYFKVNLYELKTYHEVIDEIYYKVSHLEPWEKGSRKTAGQTGMCGGVRGVGAGGIVSTAYCLLYKLFTLKLTRKQVNGLITHPDSPYIRALGFMYIRYTQPPADLWDWYDAYLEDPEEMDVKAGGGQVMTIGNILKNFLCKLEWFSTLFPRIPVPIQQKLEKMMNERFPPPAAGTVVARKPAAPVGRHIPDEEAHYGQAEKASRIRGEPDKDRRGYSRENDDRRGYSREHDDRRGSSQLDDRKGYSRERDRERHADSRGYSADRDKDRARERDRDNRDRRDRDRDRDYDRDRRDRTRRDSPVRRRDDDSRYKRDRDSPPRRRDEHDDRQRRDRDKDRHHRHRH
ncbi:pre-mRNA-splicing factor 38B-like isoform X1 [Macrosteles quadrilineatus]|uniref:pre-mRNA-splicing factor 38B-like isoform X1 n=1 Tax=Macrosteles quadrilineatus TaxID=74068 RepID=UPI0023E09139|nr:pre-mRNA-splicing factor 38B-like isoform X1 [Macrosteles quadrilineatus]